MTIFRINQHILSSLENLWTKTDKGLRDVIKEDFEDHQPTLFCHRIDHNQVNPYEIKNVRINLPRLIKTFESFVNL
jgi:hypothetical protein